MDDFNAFNASHEQSPKKKNTSPKGKKSRTFELNSKALLVTLISVVALVLLIIVVVSVINSSSKDIVAQNNTFITFENEGSYQVAMNGDIIGDAFENEVTLIPSGDNSFAYLSEVATDGGYNLYLLQNKEITEIASGVSEILAYAEFAPGIVYKEDSAVYFYANDNEDRITKDATASNFVISPDAKAVTYVAANKENVSEFKLYLFVDGVSESYASNMIPVMLSKGGEYIYAYGVTPEDLSKKLYLIPTEDNDKVSITSKFEGITYSNIDGDEIIYYTGSLETGFQTFIYSVKEGESFKIGAGKCSPIFSDPNVVAISSLKNIVVENTYSNPATMGISATYYVNKKYEATKIAQYNGQLSSDGERFYFINNDNTLCYVEVNEKNSRTTEKIADGVSEFVLTEKDNVYYLADDNNLMFYKASTEKKSRIFKDVIELSFNRYSNILYFEIEDGNKIYMTEEGSDEELVSFDRVEISGLPQFTSNAQKRTFAYILNPETNLYDVYYTSTGKTFKLVAGDCLTVNDLETPLLPPPADDGGADDESGDNGENSEA